jgi:hypothetical protein
MNSFYDEFIGLKAHYLEIRTELEDPRLRKIAFDYKLAGEYFFIVPDCVVTKPPTKMIGLQIEQRSNITIEQTDFFVRSVPRNIPVEIFNYRCFLDAEVINNVLTGIKCRVNYIDDSKGLSYNLVLRKELEQTRY